MLCFSASGLHELHFDISATAVLPRRCEDQSVFPEEEFPAFSAQTEQIPASREEVGGGDTQLIGPLPAG